MRNRVSLYRWLWIAVAAWIALPWAGCGSEDNPSTSTGATSGPGTGPGGGVGGGGGGSDGGAGDGGTGGGGTGGQGGAGGGLSCGPTEKPCDSQCVSIDDPQHGCTATGCAPCDLPNSTPICNGGACAVATCDAGFDNCDGDDANGCEVQTSTDPDNCGGCGNACVFPNGTPLCVASACTLGPCVAPYEDCDADPVNGCETIVGSDPQHCTACNAPCVPGEQCQSGVCGVFCPPDQANCDGDPMNGCETPLGTTSDCAFCGDACNLANSDSACTGGVCVITTCDPGYEDCDGIDANGCETDTDGSSLDCGACGNVCPSGPNGTPVCVQGSCGLVCDGGYEDCDLNPTTGCEVATGTDVQNCGGCGVVCTAPNGTPTCIAGQCEVASCAAGHADCNGVPADGCEADTTTSTSDCGGCGNVCPDVPNGVADCSGGMCGGICDPGFADCNATLADGCEVNTQVDEAHCGGCGLTCVIPDGTPDCVAGACSVGSCDPGYADCNNNPADGCEIETDTSLANCGGCGLICTVANGTSECVGGTCLIDSCNPGAGDCNNNPADGCETGTSSNVNNCGGCGNVCSIPNGSPVCTNGTCTIASCNAGYMDCNNSPADGCEIHVDVDVNNCGSCGSVCTIANGSPACAGGSCAVGSCNTGYGDCNGSVADGCETNTDTSIPHCGACGNACSIPNGTPACSGGSCTVATCSSGFGDCNGSAADGCEVNTGTSTSHCGACGNACSTPNGTPTCSGGSCAVASCSSGYADCNGSVPDGCEINTNTNVSHCGACGNACSTPNGTPGCSAGSCTVASCSSGYSDCDGSAANGCEVNTNTNVSHCGACGNACFIANGTPGCSSGACTIAGCNAGWGNCNGSTADGCETNLNTSANHCGACGNTCSLPNAVAACSGGGCVIAACNAGYADCDGSAANGCEVNIATSVSNCGGCGNVCSTPNGTPACSSGSCTVASCNAGYGNCDGSAANGCEVNLQTSVSNCGSCGNACSTPNGSPTCSSGSCAVGSCNSGYANCNGSPADGCEINITNDALNCGGCGNNCGSVCIGNVAATSCSAATCGITACNASYYNIDGVCGTGCECLSSGVSSSCSLPASIGTISVGNTTTQTANLVPAGKENWYTVTFTGNTSTLYHPRVRFTSNPGNYFRFDIYSNCSGASPACGVEGGVATSKTDWEVFKNPANGYNNPIPPVGNGGTILIKVYRAAGAPITCDSYTLTISN